MKNQDKGFLVRMFYFKKVDNSLEFQKACQLRYQVYCEEKGWLDRRDFPDKMETDSMDAFSQHFLATLADGTAVGTVRLILNSSRGFPIKNHPSPAITQFYKAEEAAEISRLIVSKRSRSLKVSLGLYRIIYAFSRERKITKWYMTIEPKFLKWFKTMGVKFAIEGKPSFFFGDKTQPVKCDLDETFGRLQAKNPALYAWFNADPSEIRLEEKIV